jgi:hypothetical protein
VNCPTPPAKPNSDENTGGSVPPLLKGSVDAFGDVLLIDIEAASCTEIGRSGAEFGRGVAQAGIEVDRQIDRGQPPWPSDFLNLSGDSFTGPLRKSGKMRRIALASPVNMMFETDTSITERAQ